MASCALFPRLEQAYRGLVIWRVEGAWIDWVIAQRPCFILAHEVHADVGELFRCQEYVAEYVPRAWSIEIFAVTVGDACSAIGWRAIVQLAKVGEELAGFGCDKELVSSRPSPIPFFARECGAEEEILSECSALSRLPGYLRVKCSHTVSLCTHE